MVMSSTEGFDNLIALVLSSNVMWKVSSIGCLLVLKTLKALDTMVTASVQYCFEKTDPESIVLAVSMRV
ncbi:hypothetical protein Tco_0380891 [Tanacetum coccineum]